MSTNQLDVMRPAVGLEPLRLNCSLCFLLRPLIAPDLRFPCVQFRVAGTNVDEKLGQALENILRARFVIQRYKPLPSGVWGRRLTTDGRDFGLNFWPRRGIARKDIYVLQVSDWNRSFFRWFNQGHATKDLVVMQSICSDIHSGLFFNAEVVSEFYGWYLKGFKGYTTVVAGPHKLPWNEVKISRLSA
jgi:hypothetical protein